MDSENVKWYAFLSNTLHGHFALLPDFNFSHFKPGKLCAVNTIGKRWFVHVLDLGLGQQNSAFF